MLARESPHANQLYEMFLLAPNAEHRLVTCIHHATGERTHWEVPSTSRSTLLPHPRRDAALRQRLMALLLPPPRCELCWGVHA